MSESLILANAPIVEAIVEIDCDLPPTIDLLELENQATTQFRGRYPQSRRQVVPRHEPDRDGEKLREVPVRQEIGALQFLSKDERQLVQIRQEGFSFNRLAPYTILDDYLGEIERTWGIFREVTRPVQVRRISLRFINRILLPAPEGRLNFTDYLLVSPVLPNKTNLEFAGFLNRHAAKEIGSENRVSITLVTQDLEGDRLPLIFDINAFRPAAFAPESWAEIRAAIGSLRQLTNRVFENTLTERCLNLFQ